MHRLRAAGITLGLVLTAACGSTAQISATAPSAGDGTGTGNGLTAPGGGLPGGATPSTAPGSTGTGAGTGTGVGPGAGTGAGTGTGTGGTTPGGTVRPPGGNPGVSGPGITATKIYIGDVEVTNTSAVDVPGVTRGDPEANVRAVLDDINKHGGIAGRKVEMVWAQLDSSSAEPVETQWARICQKFTQDSPKVFAVLGVGTEAYRQCIHKAGVVMLSDDLPYGDAAHYAKFPGLIEQGTPNLDRIAAAQVPSLVAQNYFSPWDSFNGQPAAAGKAKVGILTYDDASFAHAVDKILIPALKRAGYDPGVNVYRVGQVATASDYGDQAAAVQSAQLQLAANDVTHVIPFQSNGGLSLFFSRNAENQHYRPRYGINTTAAFEVLVNGSTPLMAKEQARGAVGFGWVPIFDLSAERNPDNGPYSSDSRRRCLKVYKDHDISYSDPNAQGIALGYCNKLFLLRQVLNTTPRLINATTFVRAIDRVGATFQAAGGLGSFLAPGRHDSAYKYHHWRWFDDCECMHYDGPRRTFG